MTDYLALLIGKFATHDDYRGQGIGKWMMENIEYIALNISELIGCCFIILDSRKESVEYYENKHNYVQIPFSNNNNEHVLMYKKIQFIDAYDYFKE